MDYSKWKTLPVEEQNALSDGELPEIPETELRNGLVFSRLVRKDGEVLWEVLPKGHDAMYFPNFSEETVSGHLLVYTFKPYIATYELELDGLEPSLEEQPIGMYGERWMDWMEKNYSHLVTRMRWKHVFLTVARSVDEAAWRYRETLDREYAEYNPRPLGFEETVTWETTRRFVNDSAVMREVVLQPRNGGVE